MPDRCQAYPAERTTGRRPTCQCSVRGAHRCTAATCSWPAAHPAAMQGVVEARDVDQPHCQADAGDDLARSSRPPHQGPEADCSRRHGKHKPLCRRDESCRRKAGTAKLIQDNRRAWGSACAWATPRHGQGHAPWTGTGQSPPASASAASAPPPSRPSRPCTVRLGGELTLPYPTLPMSRAHRGRMQGLRCKGRQPGIHAPRKCLRYAATRAGSQAWVRLLPAQHADVSGRWRT